MDAPEDNPAEILQTRQAPSTVMVMYSWLRGQAQHLCDVVERLPKPGEEECLLLIAAIVYTLAIASFCLILAVQAMARLCLYLLAWSTTQLRLYSADHISLQTSIGSETLHVLQDSPSLLARLNEQAASSHIYSKLAGAQMWATARDGALCAGILCRTMGHKVLAAISSERAHGVAHNLRLGHAGQSDASFLPPTVSFPTMAQMDLLDDKSYLYDMPGSATTSDNLYHAEDDMLSACLQEAEPDPVITRLRSACPQYLQPQIHESFVTAALSPVEQEINESQSVHVQLPSSASTQPPQTPQLSAEHVRKHAEYVQHIRAIPRAKGIQCQTSAPQSAAKSFRRYSPAQMQRLRHHSGRKLPPNISKISAAVQARAHPPQVKHKTAASILLSAMPAARVFLARENGHTVCIYNASSNVSTWVPSSDCS